MRAYRARQAQQRGLPLRRRGRPPRVTSDTESLQRQIVASDREIAALQARNDELTRQIALLRETGVTQDSATDGNTGTGIVPESDGSIGQDGTGTTGTVTDGNTVTGDGTQPDPITPVQPGAPDTPVTPDGPDEPDDEDDGDEDNGDEDDEDEGGSGGGIGSLRRQRDEAVAMVAELRALVEELRLQITVLQGRSEVLQTQLDRLLTLADAASPAGANPEAARVHVLSAILRRFRRELRETEAQRDRLLNRLLAHGLNMEYATVHGHLDYGRAQTALYSQIERELHIRDRYAEWEETHRDRGAERRIDPLRPLAMQVLQTTIAVRWQFIASPPLGFRQRPRWEVEGVLLDPQSEQFLVEQSQDRIEYRLRTMGVTS